MAENFAMPVKESKGKGYNGKRARKVARDRRERTAQREKTQRQLKVRQDRGLTLAHVPMEMAGGVIVGPSRFDAKRTRPKPMSAIWV